MASSYAANFYVERASDGDGGSPALRSAPPPPFRRLRGYAFDPSLSQRLETVSINQTIFETPWENKLEPGPKGEYVEVVDVDPASGCWYEPVDLNNLEVVAQDGLAPSQGNPRFHQQMVYASMMKTIGHFEHALGRQVFWASRQGWDPVRNTSETFIPRLRAYPHALRAANAYYSPSKAAILFGYFPGPTGMVFSCLSNDIIAHETTHALLDGMHRRYAEDNHEDSLAFHEAFADLVALFQHFTFPEVLQSQIARSRGDLESDTLLGEMARELGQATGKYGALRDAIGERGEDGIWRPIKPDPEKLSREWEPHARGSVLVAAVFGAFIAANKSRVQGLIRLATSGSGVLPDGAISPDLVKRLASETRATAMTFLNMCIRALDYCPPVDMTFGDYLRALITADFDLVPNDRMGYRVALMESFQKWGILPKGIKVLSEEQLRWPFANLFLTKENWNVLVEVAGKIRAELTETIFILDREELFDRLLQVRGLTHLLLERSAAQEDKRELEALQEATGIRLDGVLEGIGTGHGGGPSFEVHALRPALRVGPEGTIMKQLIMIVTQRREVPLDPAEPTAGSFTFRGGATLIFDLEGKTPLLRYSIVRPIDDDRRLEEIRAYKLRQADNQISLRATYFQEDPSEPGFSRDEPFCMLHEGV